MCLDLNVPGTNKQYPIVTAWALLLLKLEEFGDNGVTCWIIYKLL